MSILFMFHQHQHEDMAGISMTFALGVSNCRATTLPLQGHWRHTGRGHPVAGWVKWFGLIRWPSPECRGVTSLELLGRIMITIYHDLNSWYERWSSYPLGRESSWYTVHTFADCIFNHPAYICLCNGVWPSGAIAKHRESRQRTCRILQNWVSDTIHVPFGGWGGSQPTNVTRFKFSTRAPKHFKSNGAFNRKITTRYS